MTAAPVFIVGLARNCEPALSGALAKIDAALAMCPKSSAFILTNDNVDGTADILHAWQSRGPERRVVNCDGVCNAIPDRIERLAFLRNTCLLELWGRVPRYGLLIVMDLDGVNDTLDVQQVFKCASSAPAGWAGLFANQNGAYYDLYALRRNGWVEDDILLEVAQRMRRLRLPLGILRRVGLSSLVSMVGNQVWAELIYSKQYRINPMAGFLPVESAFGGLGVYRVQALHGCWYGSRNSSGQQVCEHVAFHASIVANGGELFIAAGMTNSTPKEHVGLESGRALPRKIAAAFN